MKQFEQQKFCCCVWNDVSCQWQHTSFIQVQATCENILVGHINCDSLLMFAIDVLVSLRQEHSSADGVSTLQPQPSGTCFHHSCTHHPLVVDSLELSWVENPSLHTGLWTDTSENICWKAYRFTFTLFDWIFMIYAMMVTDCRLCLCAPEINFNACKLINDTTRHETELTVQPSSAHNVALSSWKPFKDTVLIYSC